MDWRRRLISSVSWLWDRNRSYAAAVMANPGGTAIPGNSPVISPRLAILLPTPSAISWRTSLRGSTSAAIAGACLCFRMASICLSMAVKTVSSARYRLPVNSFKYLMILKTLTHVAVAWDRIKVMPKL